MAITSFEENTLVRINRLEAQLADLLSRDQVPYPAWRGTMIYQSVAQAIANTTIVNINHSTIRYDTMGGFNVGLPDRITIPFDGYYDIRAQIAYDEASAATGIRYLIVEASTLGRIIQVTQPPAPIFETTINGSTTRYLAAGSIVYMRAYQSSGGSKNTIPALATGGLIWLSARLVGR